MNNQDKNYRKIIGNEVLKYARKDPKIFLLVCDMGFGVMDQFKVEFPDRCINVGMMEQGTVGIAAGMAMTGMKPIVYSIVNFLAFRSIEQIRNDVVIQNLNVKFIATGVNNYFEQLGISHYCDQDDKKIMNLINMKVYDPYENEDTDFSGMVNEWITDPQTGYMRV
jgi:transketolase